LAPHRKGGATAGTGRATSSDRLSSLELELEPGELELELELELESEPDLVL
jgi:hypothetical protein